MAKATVQILEIPALDLGDIEFQLVGETPLIVHAWSEKSKRQMLDKMQKKASSSREVRDPFADFCDSLYWFSKRPAKVTEAVIKKSQFGFPATALKNAMVTAASSIKTATKVALRQALHIRGEGAQQLIELDGTPTMREDTCRVGMGSSDLRYRGQFWPWSCTVQITFNKAVVSAEMVGHLLTAAGFGVGVCEWRPERNGPYGRFRIA